MSATPKQHTPMTPSDKRAAKDALLCEIGIYLIVNTNKRSEAFKGLKAVADNCEAIRRRMAAHYGNQLSTFSYTRHVLNNIAELMLETSDDLELSKVVAYIDAIRDNDVAIVPDEQYKELLNTKANG